MPSHSETRRMPYTAEQMYDLVADVPRYAEFLPWVVGVRIRSDSPTEMVADVMAGFKGLRERFVSRVSKDRPSKLHVEYVEGPLKYLYTDWTFVPAPDGGADVSFKVDFAFRNRVFEMLAGQVFGMALKRMIGAFEARALQLYGPGGAAPGISSSSAHNAA